MATNPDTLQDSETLINPIIFGSGEGWCSPKPEVTNFDDGQLHWDGSANFLMNLDPRNSGWLIDPISNNGTFIYLVGQRPSTPIHELNNRICTHGWSIISSAHIGHMGRSQSNDWPARLEDILTDLGRLKQNWDGQGADAPSQMLLAQMDHALRALPRDTRMPEVEIDPTDNSVSLSWWSDNDKSAFSLTFTSSGKVYGVSTSSVGSVPPAWECFYFEETKIVDALNYELLGATSAEAV